MKAKQTNKQTTTSSPRVFKFSRTEETYLLFDIDNHDQKCDIILFFDRVEEKNIYLYDSFPEM